MRKTRWRRWVVLLATLALLSSACGTLSQANKPAPPAFPIFPELTDAEIEAVPPPIMKKIVGWGWEVTGWKKKMEERCP